MVFARLMCSDERCDFVLELVAPLQELEGLACDCGCGLEIIGWPQPVDLLEIELERALPLAA